MVGDPPDFSINTRIEDIGFFDFHRAEELITVGRDQTHLIIPQLLEEIAHCRKQLKVRNGVDKL
jgi:NTE family protein